MGTTHSSNNNIVESYKIHRAATPIKENFTSSACSRTSRTCCGPDNNYTCRNGLACPRNCGYTNCTCPPTVVPCTTADCNSHGVPSGNQPDCTCQCDPPYKGARCAEARTECTAANACNNHGTPTQSFQNDAGSCGTCNCNAGYSGADCSTSSACTATAVANSDKSAAGAISGNTGDTVTVTCHNGYTGGGTWTCGNDGNFSGTACTASSCTATQVANSDKSGAGSITGNTGNTVAVTCNQGYTGGGTWTCGVNGQFTGTGCSASSCTPSQVAASDKAANGSITGNVGDTVTVNCNDGYTGGGTWTCGANGQFTGTGCSAGSCTGTAVANSDKSGAGSITGDTGDTVTVNCNDGYTGGGTWTCGANGQFTGTGCSAGSCTATAVANSDKSAAGSITGNTGNTVAVTCNDGYTGGGDWTCGANGQFTGTGCSAGSCTPSQVPNSNKARNGDITGNTGATVEVTCNVGYTGGGTWTCGNDGNFTGTACSAMTSCTSADDCNDHASAVTGYRENDSCSCTCATGYTGDACGTATSCTIADNCSGQASEVSGNVATGCSCTCNAGRGGSDCSSTLTACTVADDCGGARKATNATGYRETGCTCQCNALWTGANCSTPSDPDADPCIQAGFACVNGGSLVPDGAPGAGGALPGSCGCAQCDSGYTDSEGTCDDTTKLTKATCESAGSTWTPAPGYTCGTPNESCTLSTASSDRGNSASGESGVYFCANGGTLNTVRPYSDASGRLCGCTCGQGDATNFLCKNLPLDTANLQSSCESNAACSYAGSRLTCQPNGQAFQACATHTDAADCGTHSECTWDGTNNKCIPSQSAKTSCLALSDNACLSQGSGCTLRGDCQAKVTSTRTGFGGAHCDIPQDAILASSGAQENLAKGIIWCNNQGYATGKTGNASCVCFPGFTGERCENRAGEDVVGCPTQDASCPPGQACCDRPEVTYCTGQAAQDGSFPEVPSCTRAKQANLRVGQSRQQRCEQQKYTTQGGSQDYCVYHNRDPADTAWNYFDQELNSEGANRLHPKCQCDCERKKSGDDQQGVAIEANQRYQASDDGLTCIANCSEISPGDPICEGLTGDALQQCKKINAPCFARGVCDPTTNKCQCNTGYAGDYCEHDTSGFQGKDCGTFGKGAAPPQGSSDAYQCVCDGDWSSSGLDLNTDGIAKCDLDPCHQGVTRRTAAQSFPAKDGGAISLDASWVNNVASAPTVTKGMGVRWAFAADGSDIPGTGADDLANVQASLVVVSYAPAGSTPVYANFATGTNADALAGNYPYQDIDGNPEPIDAATQIMLFKMQGEHNGNATGGHDKVILNKGTFLGTGTVLDFFYKTYGIVSCRVFDSTPGGSLDHCTQSSDGLSRACDCKPGWYTSTRTEKCINRCKFGTWGPQCAFKMDGTSTPDPDTGLVPNLCDESTLSDTMIDSLMEYETENGLPARCAGQTTRAAFRTALNPPMGNNTTCRVINAGPGDALDIQYDCVGTGTMDGPNDDGTDVSAQWQKGTDQNGGETDAGGYVIHDNEGQCLMEVDGEKVLCQLMGTGEAIRETNGYTSSACTMENTGNMGTCDGAMASSADQCATGEAPGRTVMRISASGSKLM